MVGHLNNSPFKKKLSDNYIFTLFTKINATLKILSSPKHSKKKADSNLFAILCFPNKLEEHSVGKQSD